MDIRQKIQEIAGLTADWDGLGADKPDDLAIDRAKWLVWALASPSRVVAAPNGDIVIERQGEGMLVEVEVEGGDEGVINVDFRHLPRSNR